MASRITVEPRARAGSRAGAMQRRSIAHAHAYAGRVAPWRAQFLLLAFLSRAAGFALHPPSLRARQPCGHDRRLRLAALPVGIDPTDNLPAGWEVYEEGGRTMYYNALDDSSTAFHPFYDEDAAAEVEAVDSAIDALADVDGLSAAERAFFDNVKAYVPPLGGRVAGALDAFVEDKPADVVEDALDKLAAPDGAARAPDPAEALFDGWGASSGDAAADWSADAGGAAGDWSADATESWSGDGAWDSGADTASILWGDADAVADAVADDVEDAVEEAVEAVEVEVDADELLDLFADEAAEQYEELYEDERLGVACSHELIDEDEDGDPVSLCSSFTYVDEATCVGCTMCATIAPQTFLMTDDHGRARSFNQEGDDEETIREAISTCPVSCIHYVPWDELVALERNREEVMLNYNFKGRLVGNEGLGIAADGAGEALQEISTNSALRCNNCPTNECRDCPMFGVGDRANGALCGNCPSNGCQGCPRAMEYPEFSKRRARRDRKRRALERTRKEEAAAALNLEDRNVEL